MERDIFFSDLTRAEQRFRLQENIRELFSLLDPRHVTKDFSATPTFDCDEAESFDITLTANITGVTLKNAYKGRKVTIIFIQGGSGSYTVAWTTTVKLVGGAFTITTTASVGSAITLQYDGSNWWEISRALNLQ